MTEIRFRTGNGKNLLTEQSKSRQKVCICLQKKKIVQRAAKIQNFRKKKKC